MKLTAGRISWADIIFCMERKHAERVRERFAEELGNRPLITLRIPDDYTYMDPSLVDLLRTELSGHLDL